MNDEDVIIATHNGSFQADDVYAVAVLLTLYPKAKVVRTRDAAVIAGATFAVDVGGEWEPSEGRFDHHQKGFTAKRLLTGVKYASAGLVWVQCGKQYVRELLPDLTEVQAIRIRNAVDESLVQHLDMTDNGEVNSAPGFYGLSALLMAFNPTHQEVKSIRSFAGNNTALCDQLLERNRFDQFMAAVRMTQELLERIVRQYSDEFAAEEAVRNAERLMDGRVLVLPESGIAWERTVCEALPDVQFVIYPDSSDKQFQVRTVPVAFGSFEARRDLPANWAGLRDAELAKVCGVPDAVFCHNNVFIAGARSKEGALAMAELTLLR